MPFSFDQAKYMSEVFAFIEGNDITIREFCEAAGISAATLYRARDTECPMDMKTIRKMDAAMKVILEDLI